MPLYGPGEAAGRLAVVPDEQHRPAAHRGAAEDRWPRSRTSRRVSSVVDPMGERLGLRPASARPYSLPRSPTAFGKPPSTDLNAQLSDASLAGVASTASYVGGLSAAVPQRPPGPARGGLNADLAIVSRTGSTAARKQANLVRISSTTIVARIQAAASSTGGSDGTDAAAQLAAAQGLPGRTRRGQTRRGRARRLRTLRRAAAKLAVATSPDRPRPRQLHFLAAGAHGLVQGAVPAIYFVPSYLHADGRAASAAQQAMTAARARLPGERPPSPRPSRRTTCTPRPSFVAAYDLRRPGRRPPLRDHDREPLRHEVLRHGPGAADAARRPRRRACSATGDAARESYVGGATAEFADVQETISGDFLRVAPSRSSAS